MSFTPGTASVIQTSPHGIVATASNATGGTLPYQYQWLIERVKSGPVYPGGSTGYVNAKGFGNADISAEINALGPMTGYRIKLAYTDATSTTVYSNVVEANTKQNRYIPMGGRTGCAPGDLSTSRRAVSRSCLPAGKRDGSG